MKHVSRTTINQNECCQGKSQTKNHSCIRRKCIRYTTTAVLLKWQTRCFIRSPSSCAADLYDDDEFSFMTQNP